MRELLRAVYDRLGEFGEMGGFSVDPTDPEHKVRRQKYPRNEPPPVTVPREPVPDVSKRKHLSRAERRALKEKQEEMFKGGA